MQKHQVQDLIEQIPQELTPDEFLVALATKAYLQGQKDAMESEGPVWSGLSITAMQGFIADYEDKPYEMLEAVDDYLRKKNGYD